MVADLVYIDHGFRTRFMPMTPAGENAWRELANAYIDTPEDMRPVAGDVYAMHLKGVLRELRKAGYVVKKRPKLKGKLIYHLTAEDLALLEALGV